MPDAVTEYLERFVGLENDGFMRVFNNDHVKDEIIRLNTEVQLGESGIKSDGKLVSIDGYAPFTIVERRLEGLQTNFMDLNFTGEFWNSWRVYVSNDSIIIDADDNKGERRLFEIYGNDVLGLTDESFEELLLTVRDVIFDVLEDLKV